MPNEYFVLLFIPVIAALLFLKVFPELFFTMRKRKGDHIAEVWLTWYFGRGATLYRQRFRTRTGAYVAVRIRAFLLDAVLPTHYAVEDWSGRPYFEKHEYGIQWGIRQISEDEKVAFRKIWSPSLPGDRHFSGEGAAQRPVLSALDRGIDDAQATTTLRL